ncbi:TIGR03086 family metal-binding protein [Nocardioides sp. YIM 152315]|uniref:TIGR03086 family metal-binding protein n=1 Tax=Nocardioides sp. YIM 152315 TaxID=3031760 RepID=UPI0023DB262D|nr:TIGR03086 family metal-binding protein [Nocardioides sp. YIM 152315]MDF1605427.1 TIGR03086 family metal-binding protein [Nocardioides sp. YIM 152315]
MIDEASAEFERVVRQLPEDSWDRPTPSEVSVRELIEHVVVGNRFTAMLLEDVDRAAAKASLTGDPLGADPVAAVADSVRQQKEAFAAAAPGQPVAGPKGVIPAAAFLRFRLVDLVVHAWDLLRAANLKEDLDPRLVADLVEVVEPHLDEMLAYGAYGAGPSGTLPPDASPQTRLLDWFGRRP